MVRSSSAPLYPEDFEEIRRVLNQHAGLWFSNELRPAIERRLRERLAAVRLDNFIEYRRYLNENPEEIEAAVEVCTINETYAFRGTRQLTAFRDVLLPRLAPASRSAVGRGTRERLVIWSAGCATGEEAYTLGAIVLASGWFPRERVHIFGTDISRRCLAVARRGVYSNSSFRGDELRECDRYFVKLPDGGRVVSEDLRAICHFRHANLLGPNLGGFIDVVFCRNVLIHMDEGARRRVVLSFYDRLSPGGYLVLGHSESLLNEDTPFEVLELPDEIVYQKPDIGSGGSRPATADPSAADKSSRSKGPPR
ncbi:MAG: protein-glutamate O-methyltransferase CheR [Polyangiaceae bacterium]